MANSDSTEYLESLERMGMTGHPGGLAGTKALIKKLAIKQGERVLDLGCGTGFTAVAIAKRKRAEVMATDLRQGMLGLTKRRAIKEDVADTVRLVAGDSQRLPFKEGSFDAVIVESVLVFCDVPRAVSELYRVLKPGGKLGFNEVTALKPISPDKMNRLTAYFGFRPAILAESEWNATLKEAGFIDVATEAGHISLLDVSVFTPLRTDGWKKYLSALAKSITDPKVRRARWNRMNLTTHRMLHDLGSGLYTARKPL